MSCTSNDGCLEWTEQAPIPFDQWKALLSKLTKEETTKQLFSFQWNTKSVCFLFFSFYRLSSNSNPHHRTRSRQASSSPVKKQDRQALPKNQVFTDTTVDSFLISSTNITQSAIGAFS